MDKEKTLQFHTKRVGILMDKLKKTGKELSLLQTDIMTQELKDKGDLSEESAKSFTNITNVIQNTKQDIDLSLHIIKECRPDNNIILVGGTTINGIKTGYIKPWPDAVTGEDFLDKVMKGEQ